MALAVVGAGFRRTGTNSLKVALEMLTLGPCHHMFEVLNDLEQLPFWQAAARGELPDWDQVFAAYGAAVDWPSARYWREISTHYPDAKVVLSVRPVDTWIDSAYATIFPSMRAWESRPMGHRRLVGEMSNETINNQIFGGRLDDKEHARQVYRAHIAEVQATIAPERLLTYDVAEGWQPLCQFLGVPVPKDAFARTNSTAEFQTRVIAR